MKLLPVLFTLATFGLTGPAAAQYDDEIWYEDDEYEYEYEYEDDYGFYDGDYEWETDDEWYEGWYGDADDDWGWDWF